ncbi:ATP-binding cassette domain-containing protein [Idiomarina xiamenensis]|uniref:Peptide ABC transporter ATPase n=1 Tax=Idiomarina xiamenensis 10-D-4 TaxID=740709 RepID=K2JMM4_9GAMM|nr:ABC transporter ATP-binding protein [Idiomarina xiamenensis]EKE84771.1 peptide ABC transporter ATPase [Idiomarina xiamenensis 10-D-4]
MTALLDVQALCKYYTHKSIWRRQRKVTALAPVSFTLERGETLAIMGETSSGKSTLAKLIAGAENPSSGQLFLNGQPLQRGNFRQRCQHIRMVFQDSDASLNPQLTIGQQLAEPLLFNTDMNTEQRREAIAQVLKKVGLLPEHASFYPHMLATGQQQRVSIARAVMLDPQIIVADEALAALDPSVRSQIINLLMDLQKDMGISYIFVSHSPEIVKHVADKILILHRGKMIEFGATQTLFEQPQQQYTKLLLQVPAAANN